jgi:hypothetical protein
MDTFPPFLPQKFKRFPQYNTLTSPDHSSPSMCLSVTIMATDNPKLRQITRISMLTLQPLIFSTVPITLPTYIMVPHGGFKSWPQEHGFAQAVRKATQDFYGEILIMGMETASLLEKTFMSFRFNHPDTHFHYQHTTPRSNLNFFQNSLPNDTRLPEPEYSELLSFMNIHDKKGTYTIPSNSILLIKNSTRNTIFLTIYQMPTTQIEDAIKPEYEKLLAHITFPRTPTRMKPPHIPPHERTHIAEQSLTYEVVGQPSQPVVPGSDAPADDNDSVTSMPLEQTLVVDEGYVLTEDPLDMVLKQETPLCERAYTVVSRPGTPIHPDPNPPPFLRPNTPAPSTSQQQNVPIPWNASAHGPFSVIPCTTTYPVITHALSYTTTPEYVTIDQCEYQNNYTPKKFRHDATE